MGEQICCRKLFFSASIWFKKTSVVLFWHKYFRDVVSLHLCWVGYTTNDKINRQSNVLRSEVKQKYYEQTITCYCVYASNAILIIGKSMEQSNIFNCLLILLFCKLSELVKKIYYSFEILKTCWSKVAHIIHKSRAELYIFILIFC